MYLHDFTTNAGRKIPMSQPVQALVFSADGSSVVAVVGSRLLMFDFATGDENVLEAERSLFTTGRCINIRAVQGDRGEAIVMVGFEDEGKTGWVLWKPRLLRVLQRERRERLLA